MSRHRVFRVAGSLALALGVALSAAPPAAAQGFGKNRIQYREFDWRIYHSPHFDIYYNQAEEHLLQKTASFAESAYDELSRAFDYQIQEPTPLIVYETHSAFQQQNIILNGVPEGAQAFASPTRFRMVLPLDIPDPKLYALIKHELTHIFQYHILFRGRLGAGLRSSPPQWFMEGMASYFADDEEPADRKFMVDAVVNDQIPGVDGGSGGYFAYRFGHALFDFIEERWGREGVLDLLFEYRNTIGSRIGRAIERTFRMDVEDFDAEFRRWARKKYLPALIAGGEPGDFGRPFRLDEGKQGQEISPAASPSGDLVAAITTDKGEVDISVFDAQKRRRLRNITPGYDRKIREIVAQFFTSGREVGRDLAFSPDGNTIAAFGRREASRSLILIDVLHGGVRKIVDMEIEQQLAPAFSPDGRTLAFAGNVEGRFDVFLLDLETNEIINLTDDEAYDGAPTFSPDGRWLAYTTYVGEHAQIYQLDLTDPSKRYPLTKGDFSNFEPVFSPDGKRIYFTSDRTGSENVYGLDLEKSLLYQYTNAITGCDRPAVLRLPEGGEKLVYTGYWKGNFDLYLTDVEEPLGEPVPADIPGKAALGGEQEVFEPDIEVSIDEANKGKYTGFKFFLEDARNFIGIDTNQIFVGRVILSFSDFLGDRRIIADLAAVDSLSDFDLGYYNLRHRWQWGVRLFDSRLYAVFVDTRVTERTVDRVRILSLSGAEASTVYPFDFYRRVEFAGGYFVREFNTTVFRPDINGNPVPVITPRRDDYPQLTATYVDDTTIFNFWGPVGGHRLRFSASYAPDLDDSGTLTQSFRLDARQYVPLTRRSNLAFRLAGSYSSGNAPDISFVGGLDTLRGFNFREFAGDRSFYANAEIRFPLIDQLALPGFILGGIRGVIFFDVGSAWFSEVTDFDLVRDDRLEDAVAAYGWGFTAGLLGLTLNWDFAKITDLKDEASGYETSFWIGTRF